MMCPRSKAAMGVGFGHVDADIDILDLGEDLRRRYVRTAKFGVGGCGMSMRDCVVGGGFSCGCGAVEGYERAVDAMLVEPWFGFYVQGFGR